MCIRDRHYLRIPAEALLYILRAGLVRDEDRHIDDVPLPIRERELHEAAVFLNPVLCDDERIALHLGRDGLYKPLSLGADGVRQAGLSGGAISVALLGYHIDVYKRQHYNCVGEITIPKMPHLSVTNVTVNTRKGVFVNYALVRITG